VRECESNTVLESVQFEACLGSSTRKLGRFIASVYDSELRPFGLKGTQVNVLVALDQLGSVPAARLAEEMHADQSTISRAVRRLRELGLVTECQCPGDARAVLLSVSSDGKALLERAYPAWSAAQSRVRDALGAELSKALLEAATRVPSES